jgi:hypothetical protein
MALALAAVLAVLDAPGLQIDWQAPATCPQIEELRARVGSLVGEAADRTDLGVTGRVSRDGEKWTLVLRLVRQGGQDTRTLTDGECQGLAEAAAVVIAVAIDPRAALSGAGNEPVPEDSIVPAASEPVPEASVVPEVVVPAPRIEPAPEVVVEPVATVPRRVDDRVALSVKIGGGVGFARLLPGVHGAVDLGLGLGRRWWRVEASGLFVPPVRTDSGVAGIGGVFRVGAGELRGCGVPTALGGLLGFPLCVGLQLGAMHGEGAGDGLAETQRRARCGRRSGSGRRCAGDRGAGGSRCGWGVDVLVGLTRPKFVTAGGVVVHEAERVGGLASVGIEVRMR